MEFMIKDKILLNMYKKINKILGGRGLTKYALVRRIKKYALENFRTNIVNIDGNKVKMDKFTLLNRNNIISIY